jgi:hypothetical protein
MPSPASLIATGQCSIGDCFAPAISLTGARRNAECWVLNAEVSKKIED